MSKNIYSVSYLVISSFVRVVSTKEEIYCIDSCSDPRNLQYMRIQIHCNPKNLGEVLKLPQKGLRQKNTYIALLLYLLDVHVFCKKVAEKYFLLVISNFG